jgi:hypothetical protein
MLPDCPDYCFPSEILNHIAQKLPYFAWPDFNVDFLSIEDKLPVQ